ncbi:hypothetical protein EhV210A [Emiliania huxleyi virus 86]|uniref:Uncharacterized protein n=1 Tax=Emiliania huxleyi virus 86 (isolate United Kingdom/English Channel/1999) TaxID=654925 RepID=Q4A2S2_EHV8U|nr:hypothetical protein EhV210A [Emiliania huxleyi virus 86]CAI65634.1 hypothetical protein EhV210A [Emiliania huxleyi virus 86]
MPTEIVLTVNDIIEIVYSYIHTIVNTEQSSDELKLSISTSVYRVISSRSMSSQMSICSQSGRVTVTRMGFTSIPVSVSMYSEIASAISSTSNGSRSPQRSSKFTSTS